LLFFFACPRELVSISTNFDGSAYSFSGLCVLAGMENVGDFGRMLIIRVRAILSLKSLFRVFSTCVLFECGILCPSNRSCRSSAHMYYSSVGYLVPRISLSGLQHLYIIRVRAILSLGAPFRSSAPLHSLRADFSCPSKIFFQLIHTLICPEYLKHVIANMFRCRMSNTKISPRLATLLARQCSYTGSAEIISVPMDALSPRLATLWARQHSYTRSAEIISVPIDALSPWLATLLAQQHSCTRSAEIICVSTNALSLRLATLLAPQCS
jgi:hypothetical protein